MCCGLHCSTCAQVAANTTDQFTDVRVLFLIDVQVVAKTNDSTAFSFKTTMQFIGVCAVAYIAKRVFELWLCSMQNISVRFVANSAF